MVDLVFPSTPWNINIGDPLGTGMKFDLSATCLFLAFLDSFGKLGETLLVDEAVSALAAPGIST